MLSINFIKQNKEKVKAAAKNKGYKINLDKLIAIEEDKRKKSQEIQNLQQELNALSKKGIDTSTKELNKQKRILIQKKEKDLKKITDEFKTLQYEIPNIPLEDVHVGEDETKNKVIKKSSIKPIKFDFKPKDHLELGELLDIIDVKTASKVSGSRFGYLKNEAVILEFALIQLALNVLSKEGFVPIIPPVLINKQITEELGYWHGGGNSDYYLVSEPLNKDSYFYLVGTAEHSLVPMHKEEVLNKKELPKRYVGFSTAFRREAGSYGKDVKGIFRVHQFDKVEMVSFTTEENDTKEHEFLLSLEEKLFEMLEIPYQVIKMCTGDLGFPIAKKYDIEAWIPSQDKYREVTSTSTTTDFQARRLNIKYQDGPEKKFVHILNGTAFAIGRTIIAILENFQQADGSVKIPTSLQKFTGFKEIKRKTG